MDSCFSCCSNGLFGQWYPVSTSEGYTLVMECTDGEYRPYTDLINLLIIVVCSCNCLVAGEFSLLGQHLIMSISSSAVQNGMML